MNNANSLVKLVLCVCVVFMPAAEAADTAGSADYPKIGRFEGSEIEFYETENYDSTTLAIGPVLKESDAESTALVVEGAVTRIVYTESTSIQTVRTLRIRLFPLCGKLHDCSRKIRIST